MMTPYKLKLINNNKLNNKLNNNNENDEALIQLDNSNILERDTSDEINYETDIQPQYSSDMIENKSIKNKTNYNSIYSEYNKNITASYIYRYTFYINLLAIIGLVINIFCYYDIKCIVDNKNKKYIDTIIINIYNINIIYYYVNIILMWYVFYISINILTFLCGLCMSIKMIIIMHLLKINNIIFISSLLLRFLQFTILSICIFTDTYIFQLYNNNKTIIYYNNTNTTTLNIHIPLYLELIILETILYIFIAFMIGIINSKISIVQTVV